MALCERLTMDRPEYGTTSVTRMTQESSTYVSRYGKYAQVPIVHVDISREILKQESGWKCSNDAWIRRKTCFIG